MREDIIIEKQHKQATIDITKAIGKGYGNFWFTNNHCRYRFLKGSRSSKKSKTVGYEIVIKLLSNNKRNILVCRQNYVDLRDTIYEGIISAIYDLGVERFFKFTTSPLEIVFNPGKPQKQVVLFRGLNNVTSLNSLTVSNGYITDCYIEEALEVENYDDFRKLDGSLRGKLPEGLFFQITCMFNAWTPTWIYTEFFKGRLEDDVNYLETHTYQDYKDENFIGPYGKGLYLHTSTYKINEFRDEETYDPAMEEMREKDPERYHVEALGMWGVGTAAVYPAFNETCIKPIQELLQKQYIVSALGIDTGLSTAEGTRHKVAKGEDPLTRVRSATTMSLIGITSGYRELVVLDEFYHTNDKSNFSYNTDKAIHPGAMTQPELAAYLCVVIRQWMDKYASYVGKPRGSSLMSGMVDVYVDSADIGFRQTIDLEARKQGLYNVRFFGGSKLSIQARVDFENALQHYGNFLVCKENCPNSIREFKNARRGEKGEARADTDDHMETCVEYAYTPFWQELIQRHNFKPH